MEPEAQAAQESGLIQARLLRNDDALLQGFEPHGELRLMVLKAFLRDWKIELRRYEMVRMPPPWFHWIRRIELFTRKWNALQCQVFVRETCNYPDDGLSCEVHVTGKHEFLRGGISNVTFDLLI